MIELGLKRVSQLVSSSSLTWKAIHVAGTNGKGSICAYLSTALCTSGIKVGRFTSPHLIDRWDCITVQNTPVPASLFRSVEAKILETDRLHNINATEFELLTATAFEIFQREGIEIGVIEVGLGGLGDATNVLLPGNILVSVIAKIGLDHQKLLGRTVEEIAKVKAGIAKAGVPVVVDASNQESVLEVIERTVEEAGGGKPVLAAPKRTGDRCEIETPAFGTLAFEKILPGRYQPWNLSCAVNALSLIADRYPQLTAQSVLTGAAETRWPGRLETVNFKSMPGRLETISFKSVPVLLDGAHNEQAQKELRAYVDAHVRPKSGNIAWVLAASKGKDVGAMIRELAQEGDEVFAAGFSEVEGMPWIEPVEPRVICEMAERNGRKCAAFRNGMEAVAKAIEAGSSRCVVAGSLYLVADIHRYLRS